MKRIVGLIAVLSMLLVGTSLLSAATASGDDRSPAVESVGPAADVRTIVGGMFTGGTDTRIDAAYVDPVINLTVDAMNRYDVTDYGAAGDGSTDDRSALNDTNTAATVSGGNIYFPTGAYRISSDLTFAADTVLVFEPGAKLSVDAGDTVTISGSIVDTVQQIFNGAGTIAGTPKVDFVRPEWWGAVGDDSTICTSAIDTAIKFASAAESSVGVVKFQGNATYVVDTPLDYLSTDNYENVTLQGVKNSVIKFTFSTPISGTHNGGDDSSNTFIDTTKNFVDEGVIPGSVVYNVTDDHFGTILTISTTTNPNDTLNVGSNMQLSANDYDDGDTVTIHLPGINLRGKGAPGQNTMVNWKMYDLSFINGTGDAATKASAAVTLYYTTNFVMERVNIGQSTPNGFRYGGINLHLSNWLHRYRQVTSSVNKRGIVGLVWLASFEDCQFSAQVIGMELKGYNINVINCDLEGNSDWGIRNWGISYNWFVSNCYFESMGSGGVWFSQAHYSVIQNCYGGEDLTLTYSNGNTVTAWKGDIRIAGSARKNVIVNAYGDVSLENTSYNNKILHCTGTVTNTSTGVGNIHYSDFVDVDANGDITLVPSGGDLDITGTLDISGDISATGGFKHQFSFMQVNVAATQSTVQLNVLGLTGNIDYVLPYTGSVMAISVASNAARSAGTLTVDVTVNGAATGLQAVLDDNPTTYAYTVQAKDSDAFSAGDRLGVEITTDGSWSPTTADIVVSVLVEE